MNRSKWFLIFSAITAVTGLGFLITTGILIGLRLNESAISINVTQAPTPTEPTSLTVKQMATPVPHVKEALLTEAYGMWVLDQEIILDISEQDQLFDFAKKKQITALYIEGFSLLRENPEALRLFIERASQHSLQVELFAGEPNWAQSENHFIPLAFLRDTIAFASASPPEQRPVGVQFFIRPYLLGDDWPPSEYSTYLALLESIVHEAQDSQIVVSIVIPFWFDIEELVLVHNDQERPLSHHIISIADRVIILNYRDFAEGHDGMILNAEAEMGFAATLNKSVINAVETQCNQLDPSKVTFCEEGETALNRELNKVKAAFDGQSWGGIAINHYLSYRNLIPFACPDGDKFAIAEPPDGYQTSDRFITVQGCGGIPGQSVEVIVELDDGPHLQDNKGIPKADGRWEVDQIVLGGTPLPLDHNIYAVMKDGNGQEFRSDTVRITKENP